MASRPWCYDSAMLDRRTSRRGLCSAVAAFVAMYVVTTEAQWSKDPVTNLMMQRNLGIPTIGDHIGSALQSAGEFAALKVQLSAQIGAAREKFWRLYPDKPGFAEARSEFARLLRDKDDYYLLVRIARPLNHPVFVSWTGGEVDGGIRPLVNPAFEVWEDSMRAGFGTDLLRLLQIATSPDMAKSIRAEAEPLYERYVARRNLEEFREAGKVPPELPESTWKLALLAIDAGIDDPYASGILAAEKGSQFETQCATEVPLALGVPRIPASACGCLQKVLQGASPVSRWTLQTNFTREAFLVASVSRIGLHEKVAGCLR